MTQSKTIYSFAHGVAEGDAKMRDLLGGKGSNLAEMTNLGIPVPPGFTISTEVCRAFNEGGRQLPAGLEAQVDESIRGLEEATSKKFGDPDHPLLVSVRSGAAVSMPGMMDTILNLGLNEEAVAGLALRSGDKRFAFDAYRRLIQMFGGVVLGIRHSLFEEALGSAKKERSVEADTDLDASALEELVATYLGIFEKESGKKFPADPRTQLLQSIQAVFRSWDNPRARVYRRLNSITGLIGTAVNVQAMVFGNLGDDSGTGVCFTRNPATGADALYGEFLVNAQGEDVVAGIRTPEPIEKLEKHFPQPRKELEGIRVSLEKHYGDMQDIEFTIEEGELFILQTRRGERTAAAALKIACDLLDAGRIDPDTAILRVPPSQLDQVLFPIFDPAEMKKARDEGRLLVRGLNAGPGAASGAMVLSAEAAVRSRERGEASILVRRETSPEDIEGMISAVGVLTATGGLTSHAAVVARGMGKCCVVGCGALQIDEEEGTVRVGETILREGDTISIDGSTGEVITGPLASKPSEVVQVLVDGTLSADESEVYRQFAKILDLADGKRRLGVRANADTPQDARTARAFGAAGIGLCRTEHMFFQEDRILAFREMILAPDEEGRKKALEKLLPAQRGDFAGIFRAMEGLPVTIRLLDPPLHEFLPHDEAALSDVAAALGVGIEEVQRKVESLKEFNPMLGHRGCRLGISFPEIYDMQARAILEAACEVAEEGIKVFPEIMIPLVGTVEELTRLRTRVEEIARITLSEEGQEFPYLIGTMIEVPRAALTADRIAEVADFFSFGTNDLTQMTFGFSR
ncbi:MAG: pyruvate, phosphate dikinase, partial [Planctomycetota bacterium]|nr:pyruvate, phosphate dikinase [Planctomycetota bacterium]